MMVGQCMVKEHSIRGFRAFLDPMRDQLPCELTLAGFVNQFSLLFSHRFVRAVISTSSRAARARPRLMTHSNATRDNGGDLSCAFY
jgi:hypothetical protein